MIYQYSENYTIDIDTVCENYTRDTDSILESYNIILTEKVDIKALGAKLKELVKSLLEKAKEFFAKLHYNLVKFKTNIVTGKDMKSAIDTFNKSYKDVTIKNLPIIIDDNLEFSLGKYISNHLKVNSMFKDLESKLYDNFISFDDFKSFIDTEGNDHLKKFEDNIDKDLEYVFFPKGSDKVDSYKISSSQANYISKLIQNDSEIKKIKDLPSQLQDFAELNFAYEVPDDDNNIFLYKSRIYWSFVQKYMNLIFNKFPNVIGKYLYRFMTTCLKIFNQVVGTSKGSNSKNSSNDELKKFDEIEEGIKNNDVKRLINALTSLIYVDRTFENNTVIKQIKYIESKGIKLKDDKLEGELVSDRVEPPYIDDNFSRAVFELKNNFCDERLADVKKIGRALYAKNESYILYSNNIIFEDGRPKKGIEYDFKKNISDKDLKNITSKSSDSNILNHDKFGTTSVGKDMVDSELQTHIENFDQVRAKYIMESKNIVEEYNKWIDFRVDEIMNNKGDFERNGNIEIIANHISKLLDEGGMSKEQIRDYIKGTFFYTTDNPNNIRLLLNLRLKYCNKICSLLNKMIEENVKIGKISKRSFSYGLYDSSSKYGDDNDKMSTAVDLVKNTLIKGNIKDYLDGLNMDLRKLGGGIIYMSKEISDMVSSYARSKGANRNEHAAIQEIFQKALKYDAIVFVHGSDTKLSFGNGFDPLDYFSSYVKLLKKYNGWDDDKIKKYIMDRFDKNQVWMIQPIEIGELGGYKIVEDALAALIDKGHKKILIEACNPGHHQIDPVFNKIKGVKVMYSDFSNLMESDIDYDNIEKLIIESENELKSLSESYGLDYDELDYERLKEDFITFTENEIINEGKIKEALVTLAKKIIGLVIGAFKKLWELIKTAFNKIKEFFSSSKGKSDGKLDKPIDIPIIITESASVEEKSISSAKELESLITKSISSLQKEISKRQKEQVDATKKLQEFIEKESSESTTESSNITSIKEALFNSENKAEVYSTNNVVITEGDLKNLGVLKKKVTRIVDSDLDKMSSKDISNQIYLLVDSVIHSINNAFIKNEWRTDYKNQISNIVKSSNRYLTKSDKNKVLSKLKYNNITRGVKADNKVVDKIVKDVDVAINTLRS